MGFFGVLALIFVGLWLLGKLLPFMLLGLIKRQQKRWSATASANTRNGGMNSKKEGEVTIEQPTADTSKTVSRQVGQYIDYEEE